MSVALDIELFGYSPAKLSTGRDAFIYFWVVDPSTNKPRRIKRKVNRIPPKDRATRVKRLIQEIDRKLAKGWNPLVEERAPKGFHTIEEAAATYVASVTREFRPRTAEVYASIIHTFLGWMSRQKKMGGAYTVQLTKGLCQDYLNWLYLDKKKSERTHNNHLATLKTFCNWLIRHEYLDTNPLMACKPRREKPKKRQGMTREQRQLCRDYFTQHNPMMWVMCTLTFHCFIRPKELRMLRVADVDLHRAVITIPAHVAKNGKERTVTMGVEVVETVSAYLNTYHGHGGQYLFTKHGIPGKEMIYHTWMAKRWDGFRQACNIPDEVVFYSLKDTGIGQMLRDGVDPNTVRQQADHKDLATTTAYLQWENPEAVAEIKQREGRL